MFMLVHSFPQYERQMLTSLLMRMELRQEVAIESSVLKVISKILTGASNRHVRGKFFFFPALVDVGSPDEIDGMFEFVLSFQCAYSWQFSIHFFQVLQLYLSFKYALP